MTTIKYKKSAQFILIALMMVLTLPAFAASKDVTMQVGETQTLYLPSSVTSLNLKSVNFYSNGISYVQITSQTNFSVTIKAIKAFSSPIIVRCDYYYYVRNGNYTYETKGYYDFNITVVGENKVQPTSISFPSSVAAVEIGESRQLTPTVLPANAEYSLTWYINDTSVASISQSGLLTGKSEGYADLKVSADNGVYTMLRIAVSKPSASYITVSPSSVSLTEGETKYLSATVSPSSANQSVTWTSSNSGVATVSFSGKVTAVSAGSCRITVKTTNGRTGYCDVTVKKKLVLPTSITIPNELELFVGENQTLSPTILPSDAETTLTWTTSDLNVALVSNGNVKAISIGECNITVSTLNGLSAICHVKVNPILPESIIVTPKRETLVEGAFLQLNVEVLPTNSNQEVAWESSDETVAEVSSNGVVHAIRAGSCDIIARTVNGLSASCAITVNRKIILPESIALPESLDMRVGDIERFTVTITPDDSEYTLIWSSSNEDIAIVSEGVVRAVGVGECEISVSTDNDLTASVRIIVNPTLPSSISISMLEITLTEGNTHQLYATVEPENCENTVVWESSNESIATVSQEGFVTAVSEGLCEVTANTCNGLTAQCEVIVTKAIVEPTYISIPSIVEMTVGDDMYLDAVILPENDEKRLVWETSDENIVAVVDGHIVAVAEGECDITVTTSNNLKVLCHVSVISPIVTPERIELSNHTNTLSVGENSKLLASIHPDGLNCTIEWISTNEDVATVVDGLITAVGFGECEIIASVGNGIEDFCHIIVEDSTPVESNITSDWSGTYHMTYFMEAFKESTYSYPIESDLNIEERNGEYFITSMLGINCVSAYPCEGLKIVVESSTKAYIDLKHNDNLGYIDLKGNYFDGFLSLSVSSEHSYDPEPIYLTRNNDNEIRIQDFYVLSFGLNTDFEHEKEAFFSNIKGSKGTACITGVISVPFVDDVNVEVYNMNGTLLFTGARNMLPQLEKGLYIFRGKNISHKILIK